MKWKILPREREESKRALEKALRNSTCDAWIKERSQEKNCEFWPRKLTLGRGQGWECDCWPEDSGPVYWWDHQNVKHYKGDAQYQNIPCFVPTLNPAQYSDICDKDSKKALNEQRVEYSCMEKLQNLRIWFWIK